MSKSKTLTREQRRLLLYLETCLVDGGGRVQGCKLNTEDHEQIDKWIEDGFIRFGRLPFDTIRAGTSTCFPKTHWVRFSEECWPLVARYRRERAERSMFAGDEAAFVAAAGEDSEANT